MKKLVSFLIVFLIGLAFMQDASAHGWRRYYGPRVYCAPAPYVRPYYAPPPVWVRPHWRRTPYGDEWIRGHWAR